jgi:glycosyltransferase involved in cell wall biosynthesis
MVKIKKGKIMLSIIMPMYNAEGICDNLREVRKELDSITKDYELVLVNDGSKNNCHEEAKKFSDKRFRVVGYKKNQGKGYAIKYGFNYVTEEYVVFLDSGGDLNPKQIRDFMNVMEKTRADIVIGSKKHPSSKVHYPFIRRLMSFTYQMINRVLFNLNVKDTQVGLKLFKKEALDKIMPKIAIKKFAFDLELLVIANKMHYKIVEAPIVLKYKFNSTISPKAVFWMLWDTAAIFYRLRVLRWYD